MNTTDKQMLTAQVCIAAPIEKIWQLWITPGDIKQWNKMSDDWQTTKVENDVRTGGRYFYAMSTKDGSDQFDYAGTYDEVIPGELIRHTLDDGRKTEITFTQADNIITLSETFESMAGLDEDMQLNFCQAVIDRFKRYVEEK